MVKCSCTEGKAILIYACSGASNVGQIANTAAVKLSDSEKGAFTCAVALGADKSGFIESAKAADRNIIIDDCPLSCVKAIFEKHNIHNYEHHIVTSMGITRGARQSDSSSEVTLVVKTINETICPPKG